MIMIIHAWDVHGTSSMAQNQDHCPRCVGCIKFLLCQRAFNLTSPGTSSGTNHAGPDVLSVHQYSDNTISPSLPQLFLWGLFLIYLGKDHEFLTLGLGVSCLTAIKKNSPLFLTALWTVCLFRGRKGTSARANNSILRVMDCIMETLPALALKYRTSLQRNT